MSTENAVISLSKVANDPNMDIIQKDASFSYIVRYELYCFGNLVLNIFQTSLNEADRNERLKKLAADNGLSYNDFARRFT